MARILYGKPVRERMKEEMKKRVADLGFVPCLAIVQVGEREDSTAYIKQKQKFGEEIGVKVILKKIECDTNILMHANYTNEERIIEEIEKLNEDKNVNGIIVQLPLPEGINTERVLNMIKKEKDADGLRNLDNGGENEILVTPATARAVMALLDFYKIEIKGKKAAVIGRSRLAGGPIADALRERGAEVEVCHRETINIAGICKKSDILVSAVGKIGLVNKDFVNKDQVVVDVGINRPHPSLRVGPLLVKEREGQIELEKPKLVGDVVFEEVEPLVTVISPVPGGVGPLTVACLFQNLLDLTK